MQMIITLATYKRIIRLLTKIKVIRIYSNAMQKCYDCAKVTWKYITGGNFRTINRICLKCSSLLLSVNILTSAATDNIT